MKIKILFSGLLSVLIFFNLGSQTPDWENSQVNQTNQEPAHASINHFPNEKSALTCERTKSEWVLPLNGLWQYKLVNSPTERPTEFPLPNFNASSWDRVAIPEKYDSNTQNLSLFSKENNKVASYRKVFPIPEGWYGQQIFVRFEGVTSAFYVWMNGKRVGYTEFGKHGAEFNVTPYVTFGRMNTLAVQVFSWSDNCLVEPCDSVFGIYSDVSIFVIPNVSIVDYALDAGLTNKYKDGTFNLNILVKKYLPSIKEKFKLTVSLKNEEGREIFPAIIKDVNPSKKVDSLLTIVQSIPHVKKWNRNNPYLYTLLMTLRDKDNNVVDAVSTKVGFREIETTNGELKVNGNIVNLDSVKVLQASCKSFNQLRFLDGCDKNGDYVIETPVQSQSTDAGKEFINCLHTQFQRDKNRTCFIKWSLDDITNTNSKDKAKLWFQQVEKIRPVE